MMMINRKSGAVGALATLGFCLAGTTADAAQGTVNSKIANLLYYEGHSGLLVSIPSMSDLGGCGSAGWYLLPETHAHYKSMVAMVLMARASDLTLQITINGCHEGYGRLQNLMILP
jgi:hypothetical protein